MEQFNKKLLEEKLLSLKKRIKGLQQFNQGKKVQIDKKKMRIEEKKHNKATVVERWLYFRQKIEL